MTRFKHLNVPGHWQQYWTKYPEGYTILEALINWVGQVDDMVDNQNQLNQTVENYGNRLDQFIEQFDDNLHEEVVEVLSEWQQTGFLDVVINEALQTQIDDVEAQLAQTIHNVRSVITPEVFEAVGDGLTDDILALEQAQQYALENNATLQLSNKTYGISRTFYFREGLELEGLSNSVIKALPNFTGDSVLKSYNYDINNIYSFGIFNVSIDGDWQNVHGIKFKGRYFAYDDLMISNCLAGGLHTDRNDAQPILGDNPRIDSKYHNYYKNGRFEGRQNGGTTFYWNHMNDSWIGEIECQGIDIKRDGVSYPGSNTDLLSKVAVHIGPKGQCEIGKVHAYGYKDTMIVESRITADLLILESYFDRALWFKDNSTFSQVDKIEVFQNLTPTGNYTGLPEGDNNVPVVHIDAYNGVQIANLFIRQFWADPEKVNNDTALTNPAYQTILDNRKTKKCLVIASNETHIGNLYIIGKHNGGIDVQRYYPIGLEVNGVNNRVADGQINFCSIGVITKSKDTGGNFVKLNFYYTSHGWKNMMGSGVYGGNRYEFYYKHDTGGGNSLFHPDWIDIDLSVGERMKYYWKNATSGTTFTYPSVRTKTYDVSTILDNVNEFFDNHTGKITKPEEIEITAIGTAKALKNIGYNLLTHTQYGSTLFFNNDVALNGGSVTLRIKIGLD
jgi:hypothetical protein